MTKSAFIYIKTENTDENPVNLDKIKEVIQQFIINMTKTGKQLDWDYERSAFPYKILDNRVNEDWIYLSSNEPGYKLIIIGLSETETEVIENETNIIIKEKVIQFVVNDQSTQGDATKALELIKFIGRNLKTKIKLFNGRIMYFNK